MSDRRPSNPKLRIEMPCLDADGNGHGITNDPERPCPNFNCSGEGYTTPEASPADLLAELRRQVESGTIKGEVAEIWHPGGWSGAASVVKKAMEDGTYIVIGPVSDGGSET